MLGHLKPRFCHLTVQSKQSYQQLYCSLCYSLRQQFGLPASFFINHELTLALAAFPDYATAVTAQCACPAKLFCQQKPILRNSLVDKAAQFSLLLVWLKLIDWETDRPAFYKPHLRQWIEIKIQPILARLTPTTRQFIDSYLRLIRAQQVDFVSSAKMSGLLASYLFQEFQSDCAKMPVAINDIIRLTGELITLADALLDLKQDIQNQQYNPIISAVAQNQTSLAEEYAQLKADYYARVQQIKNSLATTQLTAVNPVFSELMLQSLSRLNHKIQAAQQALFAVSTEQKQSRSRKNRETTFDCIENCCDCSDCFQCCENCRCCCGSGESGGSCCEGCCDCSC